MTKDLLTADIGLIQRILPHRYPFLLVDKVINIDGCTSAKGIKNVTMNEPHFQGHFPGKPIMPGVTIVEAMAQTAAVMVGTSLELARQGSARLFYGHRQMQVPPHGCARRCVGVEFDDHTRQGGQQGLEIPRYCRGGW